MNFNKELTAAFLVLGVLLTGCASTEEKNNEPVNISGKTFNNDDSFAYRLAKLSGIDDVYDSKHPKDSTLSGGLEGAVLGNLLSSGSGILSAGGAAVITSILSPDSTAARPQAVIVRKLSSTEVSKKHVENEAIKSITSLLAIAFNVTEKEIKTKKVGSYNYMYTANEGVCADYLKVQEASWRKASKDVERLISSRNKYADGGCVLKLNIGEASISKGSNLPWLNEGGNVLVFRVDLGNLISVSDFVDVFKGNAIDSVYIYSPAKNYFAYPSTVKSVYDYPAITSNYGTYLFVKSRI